MSRGVGTREISALPYRNSSAIRNECKLADNLELPKQVTISSRRLRRFKWLIAGASVVVALVLCELLLRYSLFGSSLELGSQDPEFYARDVDEVWVYRYLFSANKRWVVGAGQTDAGGETQIEFYKRWPTSLVPDAELGYVRKPNVKVPCHETSNLATRATHDYAAGGRKIAFFGDSFVESAACSSDTLTAKIEKMTGIDTLNYGIGGYGLDQIFLYFQRVAPTLAGSHSLFLVGLIEDDLGRILLKVRTSPKPYFTIVDGKLVLHTDHIHADSLNDYYQKPPERFYLYYFLRGRLGYPVYRSMLNDTKDARQQATYALSQLLIRQFAQMRQQGGFDLAFVIFPTPGAPFDETIISMLHQQNIPVVDLQGCLRKTELPDRQLYAELHPTSLGNNFLAQCLVQNLGAQGLLQ